MPPMGFVGSVKWLKRIAAVLALLIAVITAFGLHTWYGKPLFINHLYLRAMLKGVLHYPLALTQFRLLESVGLKFHADDLPDTTFASRERMAELAKETLTTMEQYDRDGMSEADQLSYDAVYWLAVRAVDSVDRFIKHGYTFTQLQSLHVRFPDVMVNYHDINGKGDAENYLTRVRKIGKALEDLMTTAQDLEKEGFTIPKFILDKVHGDVTAFHEQPVEDNPLYTDFKKKVEALELSPGDTSALIGEMHRTLTDEALPGYQRFGDAVAEMATRTSTAAGVWHLPDGDAYYQNAIEFSTTSTMTADEIHNIGLREVDRIQAEMNAIMRKQGFDEGSFKASYTKVGEDPRFHWEDSDAGREAILEEYRRIIKEMNERLHTIFKTDPKKEVLVKRVPEFKEKTSPGAYYFPESFDGKNPGTFFANLRDVTEHKKFGMRTLAYHEAVPGHHFQIAIARMQDDLPLIRRFMPLTAYTEGWALYAEQVAAENGFQDDPFDRLGYLNAQLFRAVRLVVDTGLHKKRWSRERAIDYMFQNTGMEHGEVETEIDRYCVWPGQALGYMVGRLKLLELRDRAQRKLGDKFDLREFHDAILLGGALPLEMLSTQIDKWIAEQRKG